MAFIGNGASPRTGRESRATTRGVNPRGFREYDIRGVADRDLDERMVHALGMASGSAAADRPGKNVVVGRDCRLTSPRLFSALTDGIRVHAEVIDIGVVPTPLVYFAAYKLEPAAAVMITGSHNPAEDNGFKVMLGKDTILGAKSAERRERVDELIHIDAPHPQHAMHSRDVIGTYVEFAAKQLKLGTRKLKVVVDAGTGAGGPTAMALYKALGFDVVPLYCDLDGRFPHHHPDPTQPENVADLIACVKKEGAELGLALDGDADRLGAVDAAGRILWGDQLMILLGQAVLEEVTAALRANPDVREVIDIDGVRAKLDGGWGLVRASNTQPALVMRCEATSEARLAEIKQLLATSIANARSACPFTSPRRGRRRRSRPIETRACRRRCSVRRPPGPRPPHLRSSRRRARPRVRASCSARTARGRGTARGARSSRPART